MSGMEDLMTYQRQTEALKQIAGRTGWDQETVMPRDAAPQRAEEMAAIEAVLHARRTSSELGDLLAAATPATDADAAQLRLIRRSYDRSTRIPADLAAKLAHLTSLAQGIWADARASGDFAGFAPTLTEIVALTREKAAALAEGGDLYDALLEDYEPGISGAEIAHLFSALRPGLVALREAVLALPEPQNLNGTFDEAAQLVLSAKLAEVFGYDIGHGRIDKAVHPFSSGSGLDVRITTRTDPADPFNCFYSTIHEVGHAAYEQGIDDAYLLTPVGQGASMGVHESQSRIYENQLGRSRPFTGWLYGQMRDAFGDFEIADEDAFYAAVNRVHRGFIRTEADEVQYNLHIMLRFDLERALIGGDLTVGDLEAAWNDRFAADFGYPVDTAANGVLQDVHWSVGLFGYFPTYALGNVYAGCLYDVLRAEVTGLDDALADGDLSTATSWLKDRLQQYGGLREPRATIEHATGQQISEKPLMSYLQVKFSELYGL